MTMEELKTASDSDSPTVPNDSSSRQTISEEFGAQEELSPPMEMTETNLRSNENALQWCIDNNWGLSLDELFDMSQIFLKEKDGKAFHPTYEEKLRFVALHKQASLGPYNPDACPEVGFFDLLGNDRRKEWANLGQMTKEDAMVEFIKLLNTCCPLFSPYVVSHKIEKEEQERKRREEEERLRLEREEMERRRQEEEERRREEQERQQREEAKRRQEEEERLRMEQQKQQIMAALNAQTSVQFQQYAAQQCPDQPEQQKLLIQQLQEQHYQQYIQQAYQLQLSQQQHTTLETQQAGSAVPAPEHREPSEAGLASQGESLNDHLDTSSISKEQTDMATTPGISTPSMWTRPHIKDFKEKMYSDTDSIITVGRGEVVTVRVPTNEDGNYMFWEFATDHYDIGFGLSFEWTDLSAGSSSVSTMTEPTDENTGNGEPQKMENVTQAPLIEEVVPVYRRDSHEEVYAGSHQYPGQGTYLLKFDNSYSLWRSKVVYYRVYYTR